MSVDGFVDIALPTPSFVQARLSATSMEVSLPWPLDGLTLYNGLRSYVLPHAFGCSFSGPPETPCRIHDVKIEASDSPCLGLHVEASLEFEHAQAIHPLRYPNESHASGHLEPSSHLPVVAGTQLPAVAKDTKRPQWEQVFRDIRFHETEYKSAEGRWSVPNLNRLQISLQWCGPAKAAHEGEVPPGGHAFHLSLAAHSAGETEAVSTEVVTGKMVSAYVLALLDRIGQVAGASVREKEWEEKHRILAISPAWLRGPVAGVGTRMWRAYNISPEDEEHIGDVTLTALIRTLNERFVYRKTFHGPQLTFHCLQGLLQTDRRTEVQREEALKHFAKGLEKKFFTSLAEELEQEDNGYASKIRGIAKDIPDVTYCKESQAVVVVVRQRGVGPQAQPPAVLHYHPQPKRPPPQPDPGSSWWGWERLRGAGQALYEAHNKLVQKMGPRSA